MESKTRSIQYNESSIFRYLPGRYIETFDTIFNTNWISKGNTLLEMAAYLVPYFDVNSAHYFSILRCRWTHGTLHCAPASLNGKTEAFYCGGRVP